MSGKSELQGAEIKPSTIDGIGPILKCGGPTLFHSLSEKAPCYVRMTDSLSSCPCISVSEGQLNRPVFVAILKSKVLGIFIFDLNDNHGKTVRTGILNALGETSRGSKWSRF